MNPQTIFDDIKQSGFVGGGYFRPRPAAQPTDAYPGTPEKLYVMSQRINNGEALFHPDDRGSSLYGLPLRIRALRNRIAQGESILGY